jgi:glycosyltransferase involved in cell wall biosynthesis
MKLRVAKFLRVLAFNRIKYDSYLVFNSIFTKRRFSAIHGEGKDNIVIYPAIQFKFPLDSSLNIGRHSNPYWIMIGGERQRKKPSVIINLWATSVISSLSDLVIVGEVPLALLCLEAIEKHKAGSLRFVKNIPKDELLTYISNSAASIFYSLGEGFGLPIAESLACGKTVICNDLAVFTEITGGLSLTFPTSNPTDVIQIMESVLARGPESLNYTTALMKQASEYSVEDVSSKWASFLQESIP